MTDQAAKKAAFERVKQALARRPSLGKKTGKTKVRIEEGSYVCHVEDGPWKLKGDWDEASGGTGAAPLPGVYGRAALGICLSVGYTAWAAELGVPMRVVEVEIESDFDAAGSFGLNDEPGYSEVRHNVTIESDAPEKDIQRVLDEAEKYSPWRTIYTKPQNLKRHVKILAKK